MLHCNDRFAHRQGRSRLTPRVRCGGDCKGRLSPVLCLIAIPLARSWTHGSLADSMYFSRFFGWFPILGSNANWKSASTEQRAAGFDVESEDRRPAVPADGVWPVW